MQISNGGGKEKDEVPEGAGELLRVAVIGTGKMGRCLAYLLRGHAQVTICSRRSGRARSFAKRLRIGWGGLEAIPTNDVVIAATPTEALLEFVRSASQEMRPGAVFVDVSSVKLGVVEAVESALPEGLGYVSVHPLFTSPRVREKDTAVIQVRRTPMSERFVKVLSDAGMRVFETNAEEHDRATAATQVLHHFALLTMRAALERVSGAVPIGEFTTHSFRKTQAVLRLIERNYSSAVVIQRLNKYGRRARQEFINEAVRLDREFS